MYRTISIPYAFFTQLSQPSNSFPSNPPDIHTLCLAFSTVFCVAIRLPAPLTSDGRWRPGLPWPRGDLLSDDAINCNKVSDNTGSPTVHKKPTQDEIQGEREDRPPEPPGAWSFVGANHSYEVKLTRYRSGGAMLELIPQGTFAAALLCPVIPLLKLRLERVQELSELEPWRRGRRGPQQRYADQS
ncbi:uncharacterized protein LY79DRAFT_695654 [Colletotrichum navitas]|uniref:Uncharacterized protein n=1 Tax=Colletotrichum navitas TaxID=681940 RepID=A0AAD8PQD9_9PEZI|nr:uncharacterized protein LY79DRAFT_695654 [Colletotrichum navitas]KAK1574337.1 hypothetical protein LY79DRAFT_695654 [Colletotrichum navitas]